MKKIKKNKMKEANQSKQTKYKGTETKSHQQKTLKLNLMRYFFLFF